jgi:hypothetical protein
LRAQTASRCLAPLVLSLLTAAAAAGAPLAREAVPDPLRPGALWVRLGPGSHTLVAAGPLPPRATVEIPLPLRPQRVELAAPPRGWTLLGLHPDGRVEGALQLVRDATPAPGSGGAGERLEPSEIPPFVSITRALSLGLDWQVETRVERVAPPEGALVLEVPLLPGEAVTTPSVRVRDGRALAALAPGEDATAWTGILAAREAISLEAPREVLWTEVWQLDASPIWHVSAQGIPPLDAASAGRRFREWRPWPGEKVALAVERPAGAGGATLTIDRSRLELRPGLRATDATLALGLRSSQGGQHAVTALDLPRRDARVVALGRAGPPRLAALGLPPVERRRQLGEAARAPRRCPLKRSRANRRPSHAQRRRARCKARRRAVAELRRGGATQQMARRRKRGDRGDFFSTSEGGSGPRTGLPMAPGWGPAVGVPSIKGTAFQSVVEDLCALVAAGRIRGPELAARLAAEDLRILGEKVLPGSWYPLATYRRMTELLMEVEGGGRPEYVVRRGARAAERLFAAGLYLQLERGEEIGANKRKRGEGWSEREGNLVSSLAGAIFNTSRWRFKVDPSEPATHRIEVSEAEDLPEVSRLAAQGFIEYTATRLSGSPIRVTSERSGPSRIVFTLRLGRPPA